MAPAAQNLRGRGGRGPWKSTSTGVTAATDRGASGVVLRLWEQRRQPRQVKGTVLGKVDAAVQPPLTAGRGASGRWVWRGPGGEDKT